MNNLIALTARELKSFWYSSIAYIVGMVFLLMQGWTFVFLLSVLNDPRVDPTISLAQLFFGTMWYWFSLMVMAPLLTMRAFSEEKRTGTIEVLLSAPVTEWQVVLSKFLGAWLSLCAYWLVTVSYFLIARMFGPVEWASVWAAYGFTALLCGAFVAIGIWASSLTRNQVVAGFVTFVLVLLLFSVGLMTVFVRDPEASKVIQYFAMLDQARDFAKGVVDTRPLVLHTSIIVMMLFLTIRTIALPRWRA
jgi:ABC-2 type transport system permease protein